MLRLPLAALLAAVLLHPVCSQRVLVLVEDLGLASSHSHFFQQLSDKGYQLDIKSAEDKSLRLRDWDSWSYDKLVLFASSIPGRLDAYLVTAADATYSARAR